MKTLATILIIFAIYTVIVTLPLNADTIAKKRVYRENIEGIVTTHRFTITTSDSGHLIELDSETLEKNILQTFRLDLKLDTLEWNYEAPHDQLKLKAIRKGDYIIFTGTDRGKKVNKRFELDGLPWNQTFNVGLERFVTSSDKSMIFKAIGVGGRGHLKITRFKVKRKDVQRIALTTMKQHIEAVHVTISLTGLLSIFWTGKYWYRKSDGVFLRYSGKSNKGGNSLMELLTAE